MRWADVFDPLAHRLTIERSFEGMEIGEMFRLPLRTIGNGDFTAFQAIVWIITRSIMTMNIARGMATPRRRRSDQSVVTKTLRLLL